MSDDSSVDLSVDWMITTEDNPFDPFTQWDEWYAFDERSGYHSSSLLARIINTSEDLSDVDQEVVYNLAINEIAEINASGVHKKVSRKRTASVVAEDDGLD